MTRAASPQTRSTPRPPAKAKAKLGWVPEVTFEKLIERMVKADLARLQGQPLPDFKARGI